MEKETISNAERAARAWAVLDTVVRTMKDPHLAQYAPSSWSDGTTTSACGHALADFFGTTFVGPEKPDFTDSDPAGVCDMELLRFADGSWIGRRRSSERPMVGFDAISVGGCHTSERDARYRQLSQAMFDRDLSKLYCDAIDAQPVHVDGWRFAGFDGEDLDSDDSDNPRYVPVRLVPPEVFVRAAADVSELDEDECLELIKLMELGLERSEDEDEDEFVERAQSAIAAALDEGWLNNEFVESNMPMMNFYWPLDRRRASGPMPGVTTLIQLPDDSYALGLSGGGMDCSEDLIEAYLACGYWPPAQLRLPGFAGASFANKCYRTLVAALRESNRIATLWVESRMENLLRKCRNMSECVGL